MVPKRTKQKKRATAKKSSIPAEPLSKKQKYSRIFMADASKALPTPPIYRFSNPGNKYHRRCPPKRIAINTQVAVKYTPKQQYPQAAKNLIRTPPPEERSFAERKQMEQKRLQPWLLNGKKHLKLWGLIYDDAAEQEEKFWEAFGALIGDVGLEGGGSHG